MSMRRCTPFAQRSQSSFPPSTVDRSVPPVTTLIMSQTSSTTAASSQFQAIFTAALESYQKRTKNDLLKHPLASRFKSCHSTSDILTVLQEQVQQFDKSRSGDDRLTQWLTPTINVLCVFSDVVSGGVSLVSIDT